MMRWYKLELLEILDGIEPLLIELMAHGAQKKPAYAWKTQSSEDHMEHFMSHCLELSEGKKTDDDSGLAIELHCIMRLMMAILTRKQEH